MASFPCAAGCSGFTDQSPSSVPPAVPVLGRVPGLNTCKVAHSLAGETVLGMLAPGPLLPPGPLEFGKHLHHPQLSLTLGAVAVESFQLKVPVNPLFFFLNGFVGRVELICGSYE